MAMQLQLRPVADPRASTTPLARTLEDQGRRSSWLAAQLGVHRNTMSRWVTGREPIPRARVTQIAELLDVPPTAVAAPTDVASRERWTARAAEWSGDPNLIPSPRQMRRTEVAV